MRNPFRPPPEEEGAGKRRVHEWIRDYPELLRLFAAEGVATGQEGGGSPLPSRLLSREAGGATVWGALAWRGQAGD